MAANYQLLKPDKTEVIIPGPQRLRELLSEQNITLNNVSISCSFTVKNLGVLIEQEDLSAHEPDMQKCIFSPAQL